MTLNQFKKLKQKYSLNNGNIENLNKVVFTLHGADFLLENLGYGHHKNDKVKCVKCRPNGFDITFLDKQTKIFRTERVYYWMIKEIKIYNVFQKVG